MKVGRRDVRVSSPRKVLFPEIGLTKAGLAEYYARVAEFSLPHLRDRPLNLNVYPQGVEADGFFQQHASRWFPDWVDRVRVPKKGGSVEHVVANRADTLVYLAGQNAVTLHTWPSRADQLDRPDRLVFDLDPPEGDFTRARRAARVLGDLLRELAFEPFAMVTGSKGIHVVAPIQRRQPFPEARELARGVAEVLVAREGNLVTSEWIKDKRAGRILVDVRATRGMSVVAPYSVRPLAKAPVATPIHWEELLERRLTPGRWTVSSVFERLDRDGDPWVDIARAARPLGEPGRRLANLGR
ncbi:MAG: non-homologous end-joining DNA ligase [Actinomycetota bacterium]|nr:non-homologous end-joining DNA ligase [Actinomycetota bacterium]MDQ3648346.1 non-homologous end-joining DNA ligase [Actinomycetota bacterium]